jgi:hypothetical protein
MRFILLTPEKSKSLFLFLFIAFWSLLSIASYQLIVEERHYRFDFYPRWVGSRALLQGESPYSDDITEQIQIGMFERKLNVDEDQQKFAYIAIIAFQLLPFWLLPFPFAVSLWIGLQLILLLCLPLFVWKILDWYPNLPSFITLILFSIILFRYPINSYLIGQFIPFCLASLVLAWWGISNGRYTIASIGLLLSLVRPEVVFIPVLFLLIVSWDICKFRIIKNLSIGLAAIWTLTWVMIGPWEVDYLNGLFSYSAYSAPVWPPLLINGTIFSSVFILVITTWAVWMILNVAMYSVKEKVGWLLCISAIFSLLTLPQTGNYTLILGLLVVWLVVGLPGKRTIISILISVILSLPWLFHLLPQAQASLEHLVIPLSLAFILTLKYHIRRNSSSLNSNWNLGDA